MKKLNSLPISPSSKISIRVHLTNVTGLGASQLVQSLLPALEGNQSSTIESIELPDRGILASYCSINQQTRVKIHHRRLPNALSRILECVLFAKKFDGETPLLVLGDLPLRCNCPQIVFVQTPHLVEPAEVHVSPGFFKYWVSRKLFKLAASRVNAFIVQTEVMRAGLEKSYPEIRGRVHIIAQPVPEWLLKRGLRRPTRERTAIQGLDLIYPAALYPHKNHTLLSRLKSQNKWPIEKLTLTLEATAHPAPQLTWIECVGLLKPEAILKAYSEVDALLFLSKNESFGLPLVEAMFVGLPIVCPDLPYARVLCGNQAFYFDPDDPESLLQALLLLKAQLDLGWWPDWNDQLINIPPDWEAVASKMIKLAYNTVSVAN